MRRCRDRDEIAARAGFAAGEMHLQNAKTGSFAEHPRPSRRIELVCPGIERQRVGAIRTAERANVGEFGQ